MVGRIGIGITAVGRSVSGSTGEALTVATTVHPPETTVTPTAAAITAILTVEGTRTAARHTHTRAHARSGGCLMKRKSRFNLLLLEEGEVFFDVSDVLSDVYMERGDTRAVCAHRNTSRP